MTSQAYYYDEEDAVVAGETGATFEKRQEALATIAADEDVTSARVMRESYEFDQPKDHRAVGELELTCSSGGDRSL